MEKNGEMSTSDFETQVLFWPVVLSKRIYPKTKSEEKSTCGQVLRNKVLKKKSKYSYLLSGPITVRKSHYYLNNKSADNLLNTGKRIAKNW